MPVALDPFHELAAAALRASAGVAAILSCDPEAIGRQHRETDAVVHVSSGTPLCVTDWLSGFSDDPEPVREFCREHRLMSDARIAVHLAEQCFPVQSKVQLRVKSDPESDEKWLNVNAEVQGKDAEQVVECYTQFVRRWVTTASAAAGDRICFTFSFA
jgi:hypothetical protein